MNFIFVPTVITAIIYFIESFISENNLITQFITYSPQFWTFICPIIYLILSLKAKYKIGILVNIGLILYCCSAFLCFNYSDIQTDKLDILQNVNLEKQTIKIDPRLDSKLIKYKNYDIYIINCKTPYYSNKKDLGIEIYNYINQHSKNAIIYGNLGFPARGTNYDILKTKFSEEKHYKYFKFNDTYYLFYSKTQKSHSK